MRKRLTISLTLEEHEKLVKIAEKENRTLSNVINTIVKKYLEDKAAE